MHQDRYIYYIFVSDQRLPFYIGVGKRGTNREKSHLRACNRRTGNALKIQTINQALARNASFRFEYVNDLTIAEAHSLERDLIATYGRIDLGTGCLTNAHAGGMGSRDASIEFVNRCRSFRHTDETKTRISLSHKGITQTAASIKKIRAARAVQVMPKGEAHYRWGGTDQSPKAAAHRAAVRRCKARKRGEHVPLVDQTGVKRGPRPRLAVEATAAALRGIKRSPETIAKIKEARARQIMQPRSEETKQKIAEARSGARHENFGKQLSEATKAKMRLAQSARRKMERETQAT